VIRVTAETHLHLPGMFEIAFSDVGDVTRVAGLSIGTEVRIFGPDRETAAPRPLIVGEVTSIEGIFERRTFVTVVRGYDWAHRLQRARRTRTFLNMTDSAIAEQVAQEAGLTVGRIDPSPIEHTHLGQCDQTDWDFLSQRARETGFETGMRDGMFYFRKASAIIEAGPPVELTFGQQLRAFRPRLTAGNLTPQVEVRVWDAAQATVVAARRPAATGSASLAGHDPAAVATAVSSSPAQEEAADDAAETETGEELGPEENLGPKPADDAYVVVDRPAATSAITAAATEVAAGLADHIASTFAEAHGDAAGDPAIRAGAAVEVGGVPSPFAGTWLVTSARHVFAVGEGGYHTTFEVSGRQDRSLLGLASAAAARPAPPRLPGLACGVVSNNNDPARRGRVKVALPWLSPAYESDWAPVLQFGAGKDSGAMFLPEAGDEVLIGFELGDPRRPYVLGGIVNSRTGYDLGGPAVQATGMTGEVVRRGFVSGAGNRLVFHDQLPPRGSAGPPLASDIVLGTGDGSMGLAIDQTGGAITLTCKPTPPASSNPAGQLTIQCGNAGTINLTTGPGGSVNIDGGASLSLKAQTSISIESPGEVAIKGSRILLN
jgi:uncharacterized protein involved in type VI secretion and phage assembly